MNVKTVEKKFTKFWRKAKKKGWNDTEIAAAVSALTNTVPVYLGGSP